MIPCRSLCLCLCLSQILTSPVRPQLGGLVIPCRSLCLCLCLSQILTSSVRPQLGGLVIPCFCLCVCPGLCLSQILTSSVRPQLGGLVIPCFGLCLCCFVQPACLRTRMAVPSGTAIPALSCICCSCSTEIIVPDLEAPRGSVATEWSEGTKIDHEYSFIAG